MVLGAANETGANSRLVVFNSSRSWWRQQQKRVRYRRFWARDKGIQAALVTSDQAEYEVDIV